YIALQLVGLEMVARILGLSGELPLLIAFLALALYTYVSGLRAPALIAFIKDLMVYIVVLAAVAVIPVRLGGYAAMFHMAGVALAQHRAGGLLLAPPQVVPYATLAFGSALAAFLYPHTLTGVFAARSADTIRRNAILLPAYTLLLGMIALLGYMALAAGIRVTQPNDAVPALLQTMFPGWFAGFALAAIAVGALVPATVMSIGAASLVSRNVWKAFFRPDATPREETEVARIVSLAVKTGALLFVVLLPVKFSIYLQLLGGLWILQTLPAVLLGLAAFRLRARALLAGWFAGTVWGTWTVFADHWVPVHQIHLAGASYGIYTGLLALAVNLVAAAAVNLMLARSEQLQGGDLAAPAGAEGP
ncbi:MAG TPA: sodium:solute symporter, partial [Acetobacteraceae bacterium]|nr:sodium:solute symporter [Acetobacteraceae bacterium]